MCTALIEKVITSTEGSSNYVDSDLILGRSLYSYGQWNLRHKRECTYQGGVLIREVTSLIERPRGSTVYIYITSF